MPIVPVVIVFSNSELPLSAGASKMLLSTGVCSWQVLVVQGPSGTQAGWNGAKLVVLCSDWDSRHGLKAASGNTGSSLRAPHTFNK